MNALSTMIGGALTGGARPDEAPRTASATDPARHPGPRRPKVPAGAPPRLPALRVTIIDVGKGDCILVQASDVAVLIDTGYESTAPRVLSILESQGVDRLDAMIITHYDRDHVDGIRAIGTSVNVGTIYLPDYEGTDKNYRSCIKAVRALGTKSSRVAKELVLSPGDARLYVIPSRVRYVPGDREAEGNDNDMSLVARLTLGRDSYLFAGDLEEEGIGAYLMGDHGRHDVLKMPHHGQHSLGTSEFLDDVRPKIAVITDSEEDAADKKTLKLLKSADVRSYRTSVDGTVVVESDGSGTYAVHAIHAALPPSRPTATT